MAEQPPPMYTAQPPPAYPQQPGYQVKPGPAPYPQQPYAAVGQTTTVIHQPATVVVAGNQFFENPVSMVCPYCHATIVTSTLYEPGTLTWLACGGTALVGYVYVRLLKENLKRKEKEPCEFRLRPCMSSDIKTGPPM